MTSPLFQSVKGPVEFVIVPFYGHQLICRVDTRKGIDQVGAQIWINVCWHKLPTAWSVLGPVCEITNQSDGRD